MKGDPPDEPVPPGLLWVRIRKTVSVVFRSERKESPAPEGVASFFRHEKWGLVWVAVLALGMQFLEYHGWLAGIEGRVLDWFLRNTSRVQVVSPDSPVLTVEIDDDSYRDCFGATSPLDANVLAQMIRMLAKGTDHGPKIIGVDILTDSERDDQRGAYKGLAEEFKSEPGEGKQKIVWASGGEDSRVEGASFGKWLLGRPDIVIVRPSNVLAIEPARLQVERIEWGLPVFPRDEDLRLRRYSRHIEVSSDPKNSLLSEPGPNWARTIATDYCETTRRCTVKDDAEEVFVSSGVQIGQRFAAHNVFRCSPDKQVGQGTDWGALTRNFAMPTILLLGGTYANGRDTYETPDGPVSGLRINAYAIQAELDGATISEAWRPLTVLGDLCMGTLVVYVFWKQTKVRRMIELSGASILLALLLSLGMFELGKVWLSCIGVALGVVLHMILEVYKMDLRKPKHRH